MRPPMGKPLQVPDQDWISARAVARHLGVTEQQVPKLAARGLIGVRKRMPGIHARYSAADVAALAAKTIIPKSEGEQPVDSYADGAKLRQSEEQLDAAQSRLEDGYQDETAPTLLAKTTTDGSYPTTPGVFFRLEIVKALGSENDAGPVTYTGTGQYIYATHVGQAVPPIGTVVLCQFVPDRYVFEF
jgi:hypothetical protein